MGSIVPDDRKVDSKMNRIIQYINTKFEPYAGCQEVNEIKEEIISNCMDRYNDSLARGKSESDAYETVMESLGDLDTLIASIAQDHPSDFAPSVKEEQPFDEKGEIHTIEVSVLSSDVILTSSNTDEIVVETSGNIIQDQVDGVLNVREETHVGSLFFSSSEVKISVPHEFKRIHVNTKSGDIDVSRIDADSIYLHSTSGDIDGALISGDVLVRSTSGDIDLRVSGNNGEVKISTTSGDVDVRAQECRTMDITTTSGDIDLCLSDRFEVCRVNSVAGDIDIDLKNLDGAQVHMRSMSGDCVNHRSSVNGYNVIEARTISGDITIR